MKPFHFSSSRPLASAMSISQQLASSLREVSAAIPKTLSHTEVISSLVLDDLGVPNYSCDADLMKASKKIPTNVNSVRPADIKVVMALGDSLTVDYLLIFVVTWFLEAS